MLFLDKLNQIAHELVPEFERLFQVLLENQSHDGDLLLVYENGFYDPEVHTWNSLNEKFSPYVIGPSHEGHSAYLHYEFIHEYRTNGIMPFSHTEYMKKLEYSEERQIDIELLKKQECYTIQLEMLIYLKIWESDTFIKRFYQIVRLIHGEPYDWHFKVRTRDSIKDLITIKIIDRFKNEFPKIYRAFKESYIAQVRNSIAHSNYSFLGRNINLNNSKGNSLYGLTFEKWIEIFHTTMIISSYL